jgi:hypothetical protein
MTHGDTLNLSNGPPQAIRRLPTGRYELSANLQRHQPTLDPVFLNEAVSYWKIAKPVLASVMVLIGITGLVMLVVTPTKLPIESRSVAPAAPDRGAVPTALTQFANSTSTVPGEWLIDDVGRARGRPDIAQARPDSPSASSPALEAQIEVPLRSRLAGTERALAERGLIGKPATLGSFGTAASELRSSPTSRMREEKHGFGARQAAHRSAIKSARRKHEYHWLWDNYFEPWPGRVLRSVSGNMIDY